MEREEIDTLVKLLTDPMTMSLGFSILDQDGSLYWEPRIKNRLVTLITTALYNQGLSQHEFELLIKAQAKMVAMGVLSLSEVYGTQGGLMRPTHDK